MAPEGMSRTAKVTVRSCSAVVPGARHVLRARPTAATIISRVSGTATIVVGLGLVGEQLLGVGPGVHQAARFPSGPGLSDCPSLQGEG